jgi:hypothetical protein
MLSTDAILLLGDERLQSESGPEPEGGFVSRIRWNE